MHSICLKNDFIRTIFGISMIVVNVYRVMCVSVGIFSVMRSFLILDSQDFDEIYVADEDRMEVSWI